MEKEANMEFQQNNAKQQQQSNQQQDLKINSQQEEKKELNIEKKDCETNSTDDEDQNSQKGQKNESNIMNQEKQKKKKNKKNKRKNPNQNQDDDTDYEVDVRKKAMTSQLLQCETIQEHLRMKYALLEANPFMLIVSNIPPQVSVYEIRDYFTALIQNLRPEFAEPPPIKNVEISSSKQFASIEFQSKQAKNFIRQLKGLEFHKNKLYIEKASQYFNRVFMDKIQVDDALVEGDDSSQDTKIYMGGLPTYLKDAEIKKLCETFGKLKYFHLAKQQNENKEWVSKGYCFFEYEDKQVTERAIKALNGLPCGDRKLKVSKVTRDQNKLAKTQQIQNDRARAIPSNQMSGSFLGDCHLIKHDYVKKMLLIPEYTYQPSRVIQLLNMCSLEDLFEDDICNELYQDVLSECEKLGNIEKIEIVRPCKITGICPPSVGKIFVKFKYLLKAKRARHVLSGRTYNKRTVVASFYPEEKFDCKDFLVNLT